VLRWWISVFEGTLKVVKLTMNLASGVIAGVYTW
jgi:hypothetical protein